MMIKLCSRVGRRALHDQALDWVAEYATANPVTVVDLGGRDINGTPRYLFPNATRYTVIDILPGEGVDIVADAATWEPDQAYDVILCCEIFEHTAAWPAICRTAYKACKQGGLFIITTAGPGRPPHSMIDGLFHLHPGEHYANVPASELQRVLIETGWHNVITDSRPRPADTRAVATK